MDDISKIPEVSCIECGKMINVALAANGSNSRPNDGDLFMCLHCGATMAYEDRKVRPLNEFEVSYAARDKDVFRARKIINSFKKHYSRRMT
jgi:hypothetical protein